MLDSSSSFAPRDEPPLWFVLGVAAWFGAVFVGDALRETLAAPRAPMDDADELSQFFTDVVMLAVITAPQLVATLLSGVPPRKLAALAACVVATGAVRAANPCALPLLTSLLAAVGLYLWRPRRPRQP